MIWETKAQYSIWRGTGRLRRRAPQADQLAAAEGQGARVLRGPSGKLTASWRPFWLRLQAGMATAIAMRSSASQPAVSVGEGAGATRLNGARQRA